MIKKMNYKVLLIVVILFSALVFAKVLKGRTFDFGMNNQMITVAIKVEETAELEYSDLINEGIHRSGVVSDGEIASMETIPQGYRIVADIPVTRSGPYMKFGSQPIKMGSPIVIEGDRFYFNGIIIYIEAGEENEK
ncbi:MAG: hypothetical protein U9Q80_07520 [Bacillota bacterium]|nr:hypothetical protein [Bacillota bacterium]